MRSAVRLFHEGDLGRAQMLLEALDTDLLEPRLALEANYLCGVVLARRGDPLEAAHRFQLCVRQDPRFFPALDAWGNVLAGIGDARGAIEKYKRALAVAPGALAAHVLFNYGVVLLRNGYNLRALRKFRESFRRDPRNGDAAYMTGLCFLNLKRPRGARKWFKEALEIEHDSPQYMTAMGNALAMEQRDKEATVMFQMALHDAPEFHDAWYNWAANLAARGDYANAIRKVKSGLKHHPNSFELLTQQVFCLRQMGAYDAALAAVAHTRSLLGNAPYADRAPHFADLLAANEAGALRALGRGQQARAVLLKHLRQSVDACPAAIAELRYHDSRALAKARRMELTVSVAPAHEAGFADEEPGRPRAYQRTYWVMASNLKEARRLVRELEPQDATVRFDPEVRQLEHHSNADGGVTERTPAIFAD